MTETEFNTLVTVKQLFCKAEGMEKLYDAVLNIETCCHGYIYLVSGGQ